MQTLTVEDRIDRILSLISISDISDLQNGGNTCPCCGKRQKLWVWSNQSYKCFYPGCELSEGPRNVISLYRHLNHLSSPAGFYQALQDLEQMAGIETSEAQIRSRSTALEEALAIYQETLWSEEGQKALYYLEKRGFSRETINEVGIGYAPPRGCLRDYNVNEIQLVREGLIKNKKDYFRNRIIFPLYNSQGYLIHLQGRYLGDIPVDSTGQPLCGRYKDSRHDQNGSKNYLFLEHLLKSYSPEELIIAEGAPDALSFYEAGLASVGLLGLEKLTSHYHKLRKFKRIVFAFDNDRFEEDHAKYPNEYKSWISILPQILALQILAPNTVFELWTPPESFKDANEFLQSQGPQALLESIQTRWPFPDTIIHKWGPDLERHKDLIKLVSALPEYKEKLRKYIPFDDPLDYAIEIFQTSV